MEKLYGQTNEYISSTNKTLVLQHLQREGISSRAEISKLLNLTPASITKIVSGLIEDNILEEVGYIEGKKGRPSRGISIKSDIFKVIGVKLSRRNFAVGVFDFRGTSLDTYAQTFSSNEKLENVLGNIKKQISFYLKKYPNVLSIGMAVPGPYLEKEGKILLVTETNNWKNINIKEEFNNLYDIPFIIKHDANSGVLADWWYGSQKETKSGNIVHYLVGEGVGAGLLVDGNLFEGDQGLAGEIGHISIDINGIPCACGNFGCLERYCSSIAFVEDTKKELGIIKDSILSDLNNISYSNIFHAANLGDSLAVKQIEKMGRYIGFGVVNLINLYNPTTIIISNDMALGGQILLDSITKVVKSRIPEEIFKGVNIEISMFTEDSILLGACAVAVDYCLKNPNILVGN